VFSSLHSILPLDSAAHVIQTALTPVFLLAGLATLLNVFSTRLARVADRAEFVVKTIESANPEAAVDYERELSALRRRSVALDAAIVLGACGGGFTCVTALTLFLGTLEDATIASLLFAMFGLALLCATGAIGAYTVEMMMAGSGVRADLAAGQRLFRRHRHRLETTSTHPK
jgi:hypothetical protein